MLPLQANNMQNYCDNLLKKDHIKGSIIVYDAKKDKIIALTSPNIAKKNYYPMGSTFKIISAFALRRGRIYASPTIHCNNYYNIAGRKFICTKPGGHGDVNLSEAIAYSCSVYFYNFHKTAIPGQLSACARLLLDDKVNKCKIKEPSDYAGLADMLVGDGGFVKIKPIQMINLLKHLIKEDVKADKNCYAAIKKGMKLCCINGTAYCKGGVTPPLHNAAGKTGTAVVVNLSNLFPTISRDLVLLKHNMGGTCQARMNGWFVGWAPADKPKTAIVVFLENGKGYEAAQIAGKVLKQTTEAQRHRE